MYNVYLFYQLLVRSVVLHVEAHNVGHLGTRPPVPVVQTVATQLTTKAVEILEKKYLNSFKQISKWSLVLTQAAPNDKLLPVGTTVHIEAKQPNVNKSELGLETGKHHSHRHLINKAAMSAGSSAQLTRCQGEFSNSCSNATHHPSNNDLEDLIDCCSSGTSIGCSQKLSLPDHMYNKQQDLRKGELYKLCGMH